MKKVLAITLLLALAVFAGCTRNTPADTAPQDTTLTEAPTTPEPTEAVPTEAATEESEPTEATEATEATEPTELPTQPEETQPPVHTHTFSNATCTVPAKCVCGVTTGSALGHSWQSATCYNPQSCTRCFATQGSALGHDWQEATCQSPKACPRCGKTEGDPLPHNYENGECSSCGDSQYADISLIEGKEYYTWVAHDVSGWDDETDELITYKRLLHCILLYSSQLSESDLADFEAGDNTYRDFREYAPTYPGDPAHIIYDGKDYSQYVGGNGEFEKSEIVDNCLVVPNLGKFALQKDGYLVLIEYTGSHSEDGQGYIIPAGTLYSTDKYEFVDGYYPEDEA